MSANTPYMLARNRPGQWQWLGRPLGRVERLRRIEDGYVFEHREGDDWVKYVGLPEDIEVNPGFL